MNRGDIKLVIDELNQIEDADYIVIYSAVTLLETLGNKVAEQEKQIQQLQMALADTEALEAGASERVVRQAAVIEKISEKLKPYPKLAHNTGYFHLQEFFEEILAIPTDSKKILADWMREQMSEPATTVIESNSSMFSDVLDEDFVVGTELFMKPECLK